MTASNDERSFAEDEQALRAELERVRAELRESRERLQAALSVTGGGTFRWDVTADVLQWDESLGRLLALQSESTIGSLADFGRHLHPEDQAALREQGTRSLQSQKPFELSLRVLNGSGVLRWLSCRGHPLPGVDGEGRLILAACRDISDQKRVEDAQRDTAERFRLALDAGLLGDWTWDAKTDAVRLGDRANRIFGLQPDERLTWTALQQRLHPDDRQAARVAVERAARDRTDYELEYRVIHPDGSAHWVAARGRGVYDADGRVLGMIGVVQEVTARKRAEEALLASELRLRVTFEHAAVGIAMAETTGRFFRANHKFCNLLGYQQEELKQLTFFDITHPQDRESTQLHVGRLLDGNGSDFVLEKRYLRKSGEVMWSRTTVSLLRNAMGEPQHYIAVIEDITQHKRTEEALRASEEFARSVIQSSEDCIETLDAEGKLLWVNDAGLRRLQKANALLVGRCWLDLWSGEDRDAARRALDAARQGQRGRFVGQHAVEGESRWWDVAVTPVADGSGRITRLLAVLREITERVLAERTLREQARLLELLNQTGARLASQLDLQTLLQMVTDAATEMSGAEFGAFFYNSVTPEGEAFSLYTLSGAPREAFKALPMPRATALFGPTFRGEGIVRVADVLADPRYGKFAPYHGMPRGHLPVRSYLAVPIIGRSGEVFGGLFFGHKQPNVFTARAEQLVAGIAAQAAIAVDNARLYDAAQKAAEERQQLLESERAARTAAERLSATKDEFLATLSHELRTPLSAILGWSQVLQRQVSAQPDLARGLEVIERNARVQTQLIDDLLDMSRITSGKLRLNVQSVHPALFIEAAMETVRPAASGKGVHLVARIDPQSSPVLGDPGRLQQIVWNLLSNAIKFTPKGGTVEVQVQRRDDRMEIAVADTGVGIRPDFLPHVFDRFRQADASTTRRFGGLGLGLAIVRHLVELHGGSVSVHSAGEGAGSTFVVQLPVASVLFPPSLDELRRPDFPPPQVHLFQPVNLGPLKVLVVDDEPDARELLQRLLSECRLQVLTAANADEALQLLERERPEVLITDIGMPGTDGFQLLRAVRARGAERGGQLPAVALTAFARPEDRARVLQAGFAMHLSKPIEPAELISSIRQLARQIQPSARSA